MTATPPITIHDFALYEISMAMVLFDWSLANGSYYPVNLHVATIYINLLLFLSFVNTIGFCHFFFLFLLLFLSSSIPHTLCMTSIFLFKKKYFSFSLEMLSWLRLQQVCYARYAYDVYDFSARNAFVLLQSIFVFFLLNVMNFICIDIDIG